MWSLIWGVSSVQILRCWGIQYQRPLTWGASSAWVLRCCVASFTWVLRCCGLGCQRIEDAVSDLGSRCCIGPGSLSVRKMEGCDLYPGGEHHSGPDALGIGSMWVLRHLWLRCWREEDVVLISGVESLIQVRRNMAYEFYVGHEGLEVLGMA